MGKAFYDSYDYPKYWHGRDYEHQAEVVAIQKFLTKIPQRNLPAGRQGSILDLAGGFGRLAPLYAPIFQRCLLVDPSKRLLNQAQKYLKEFPNVEIQQGDVEKIPALDNEFDVVLLIRIVHHLPDPYLAFREVFRVLKPGGFLIVEFANKIHFRAIVRSWLDGDFDFIKNLQPIDQRSPTSIAKKTIPFLNHHPQTIYNQLNKSGFKILSRLSVSNFRFQILKKNLPLKLLLLLESISQRPLAICHFGPSIFLLCQKPGG